MQLQGVKLISKKMRKTFFLFDVCSLKFPEQFKMNLHMEIYELLCVIL